MKKLINIIAVLALAAIASFNVSCGKAQAKKPSPEEALRNDIVELTRTVYVVADIEAAMPDPVRDENNYRLGNSERTPKNFGINSFSLKEDSFTFAVFNGIGAEGVRQEPNTLAFHGETLHGMQVKTEFQGRWVLLNHDGNVLAQSDPDFGALVTEILFPKAVPTVAPATPATTPQAAAPAAPTPKVDQPKEEVKTSTPKADQPKEAEATPEAEATGNEGEEPSVAKRLKEAFGVE